MPRIQREGIPEPLMAHLIRRVRQREISTSQLGLLAHWVGTNREVPEGKWFKRFPEVIVCGESELVKTFLRPDKFLLEKRCVNRRRKFASRCSARAPNRTREARVIPRVLRAFR